MDPETVKVIEYIADKLVMLGLILLPAIVLYVKAKAAEVEAHAAKIQSEINTAKADAVIRKIDDNTLITKTGVDKLTEVHKDINGRMDQLLVAARAEGVIEGKNGNPPKP